MHLDNSKPATCCTPCLTPSKLSGCLKSTDPKRTVFIWDASKLLQEYTYKGAYTYVYTEQDSYEPLAHVFHNNKDAQLYLSYYHTDQIGIPREQTDQFGNLLWLGNYDAWGSLKEEQKIYPNAHQPFRLQNQYCDQETGLHYNLFRYYEPTCGRFMTQDPIGLVGGENLYQFAPNVLEWVDPLGWVSWGTARRRFWIAEAKSAPKGMYSPTNLARMKQGKAPRIQVEELHIKTRARRKRNVSIELNHRIWPQRCGKNVDVPYNLEKVTPWEHEKKDPYRKTGTVLLKILKNIDKF